MSEKGLIGRLDSVAFFNRLLDSRERHALYQPGDDFVLPYTYYRQDSMANINGWSSVIPVSGGGPQGDPCCEFNGTSSECGGLQGATNSIRTIFSVSCWVYPTDASNHRGVAGGYDNSINGFIFLQYDTNGWKCYYGSGSGWTGQTSVNLPLNQWSHIVTVYKSNGYIKTYLNGVLAGSVSTTGQNIVHYTQGWIGKAYNAANRYFQGRLYDFRIYARELTASEALALYNFERIDRLSLIVRAPLSGSGGSELIEPFSQDSPLNTYCLNNAWTFYNKIQFSNLYVPRHNTLSMWVKTPVTSITENQVTGGYQMPCFVINSSLPSVFFNGSTAAYGFDVQDAKWHHITITSDEKNTLLIIDGKQAARLNPPTSSYQNGDFAIGSLLYGNFQIYDVRFYHRALSIVEAGRLSQLSDISDESLFFRYKLDDRDTVYPNVETPELSVFRNYAKTSGEGIIYGNLSTPYTASGASSFGTNKYLASQVSMGPTSNQTLTLSVWVLLRDKNQSHVFISKSDEGLYEYQLMYDHTVSRFAWKVTQTGSSTMNTLTHPFSVYTDTWYLLTATLNRTNNQMQLYVNDGAPETMTATGAGVATAAKLYVGTLANFRPSCHFGHVENSMYLPVIL